MGRKSKEQQVAEKEMARFDVNYASKPSVAERALKYAMEIVYNAKRTRRAKEEEWLEDLRLWACQNSDAQMYMGRSNIIIPELHNQVESSVGQFQQGLFPTEDYIGNIPMDMTQQEEADMIRDAVYHELDHKNDLPSLMERFQRQKVLFGSAFLKPVFEKKLKSIVVKDPKGYKKFQSVPQFQGVRVHVQDTFHSYVYPETVNNISEAIMYFDETFVSKRMIEEDDTYENKRDLQEVPHDFAEFGWIDSNRMQIANLSSATAYHKSAVVLTECWCDFDIVPGEFVPCVITIANYSRVVRVARNPFWHQSFPALMGRYLRAPSGEVYGHSLPERIRSLQYMIADLGNQTMDSLTYTLNPIALIDPGFAGDVNSFKMQPGARWFASPQGVSFQTFPDISQSGFQGMQQVRQMIQQFSDLAPQVAPQLSGKVRSATQSAQVQQEVNQNLKNLIRADEFEVMSPLCDMTHKLLQQFQDHDYQVYMQGPKKGQWITKIINPNSLHRNVAWIWRGSEVAAKTQIRGQQLLSAFNLAMQAAQAIPGSIDIPELFKVTMKEAFDLNDVDVFPQDREKLSVDPAVENLSLDMGGEVKVNPGDVHEEHMRKHREGFEKAKTDEAKIAYIEHMELHELRKKAKDTIMQQQAQVEALQSTIGEGAEGGGEGANPTQFAREGNPYSAPSSMSGLLQGMRSSEPNI